jgi:hypothetical protein
VPVDADGETVAVRVTLWLVVDGFALEVRVVVVVERTVNGTAVDWLI